MRGKVNKKTVFNPKVAKLTKHNAMFLKGKEYGLLYQNHIGK